MSMDTTILKDALYRRERDYSELLDRLRDRFENDAEDRWWQLQEAIELVRCLRRLLDGRSVAEIHKAFGAPGNFGYESAIGSALAKLYREESRS